jgi:hypothetical protein
MKLLLALILSVVAHGAWAQSVELHVMLNGSRLDVNEEEVVAALTAMVESASVDTTRLVHPAGQWDDALAAPIFIHALFDRPRQMRVRREGDGGVVGLSAVREIVVVMPNAWQIFLKTSDGVRSVAKYSPCSLERVLTTAKLDTISSNVEYLRKHCGR